MSFFKSFEKRSSELELIDQGSEYYTEAEYDDCLTQLGRIGQLLGGDRATLKAFKKQTPKSILDVGCGGGHFTLKLAEMFPHASVVGIDISRDAIMHARQELLKTKLSNVTFEIPSTPQLNYPRKSFDIVTCTLVCHHLTDKEIVEFLKKSYQVADKMVVINDLHRHPLAYLSFSLVTPLFSNRLITHDGLLSIKRSFTKAEWIDYLKRAEIPLEHCSITWNWAFRWVIKIHTKLINL